MKTPKGKKQGEPLFKIDTSKFSLMGGWKSYPEFSEDNFWQMLDHYNRVPVVSTAIDLQVDECLSEGYQLTAVGDMPQDIVDTWARDGHFHKKLRQAILGRQALGNWFIYKDYDAAFYNGNLPNLQGIPPWVLHPIKGKGDDVIAYVAVNSPGQPNYDPSQIGFIKGDSISGSAYGKGLIAAANTEIVFKRSMEEMRYNIYKQYSFPIFLLMPSKDIKNISSGDMTTMMQRFDQMSEEKSRIVGLPNSMTLDIIGVERKIPEAFIAWAVEHNDTQLFIKLRVPPVMLERGQNATEATAKVQVATHNRFIKSVQDDVENVYNADILLDAQGQPFAELELLEPKEPSWQAGAGMTQGQQDQQGKPEQKGVPSQAQNEAATDWMRVMKYFTDNPEVIKRFVPLER